MTQDKTEMILTERDTCCETEQGNSLCTHKEMSPSRHTLSILMEQLRSSLGAGKEQPRVWLEAGKEQLRVWLEAAWSITLLLALMTLGATNVWAQAVQVQDGGYYYISIKEKVTPNPTPNTNYYICPTENWIYFDNNQQYGYDTSDNGKPFMTTYQCRNTTAHPEYDPDKAIWVVEKQKTENEIDYYSIRHAIDGRYLTYNANLKNITKGGNNNRLRFHLEASNSPKDNINMLFSFVIPSGKSYYVINPKPVPNKYICITEGNVDELQGSTTSPTGNKKVLWVYIPI